MTHRPEGVRGRRVLVTGGSGFIGTNVVEAFLRDECVVLNVDIAPPKVPAHAANWQQLDILDDVALRRAFASFRPELVIHLAAKTVLDERTTLDSLRGQHPGRTERDRRGPSGRKRRANVLRVKPTRVPTRLRAEG